MLIVRGSASFVSRARFSSSFDNQLLGGDRDGDHLAAFFGGADRKDFHARAGALEHAHVLVNIFGVRQLAGRAGNVAEHGFRRRHVRRSGQVVGQRRVEVRRGCILANLVGVFLIDWLIRIAARFDLGVGDCCRKLKGRERRERATERGAKGSYSFFLVRLLDSYRLHRF